ncbi:hypothetical protein OG259_19305 [Streptomyces sp. NBC_00250]|uniref:hypothetical protein n=1 Tax=Streptomyces sp. NBC_00250 TaxID=2903641 RepID=UPI002E2B04F0|nr:hypothetical protein [Streptomyces sp. NBC_00250]
MSDAASIALITALSTLAGAGITSWLSLLTNRHQFRHQERLTNKERDEARRDQYRTTRKEAYVQFINQAVRTAHAIGAMVKPEARVSEETYLNAATQADERLAELWPLLALVTIEGPAEVADLADQAANALMAEGAKAGKFHRHPDSKEELIAASRARWQAQRDFARAARDTVAIPAQPGESELLAPPHSPELAA